MKNKLFYKIFLNYIFVIFLLSVLFVIISNNLTKKLYINNIKEILKDTSYLINENIKDDFKNKKYNDIDKYIKKIAKDLDIRITIIKDDGVVIADSDRTPIEMDNHANRPEILMAQKNQTGYAIRYSQTVRTEMLYFARKFFINNQDTQYFIRTSFYLKNVNAKFKDLRNKLFLSILLIFFISIILIYFYSKKLYKPIYDLKLFTTKIARGDFESRVVIHEKNEFKDLGDNFNFMAEEIKKLFNQLKEKQDQLDTIISSIDEGIMVIDKSGKIIFVNKKFNDAVDNICIESKFYWEFLLSPELVQIIDLALTNKIDIYKNINIKNKNFLCRAIYIIDSNQVIIILFDISQIKELEKLKKDLIANVSHEIKTPLTSIKGFTETALEETKDKKIIHYLKIIDNNTQRLINIIEDLLVLSDLERDDKKIKIESINLRQMLDNIEKLFIKKLTAKNLVFKVEIYDDIKIINADKFMLEQIFINLIDNAIKYTDKGNIKVSIYKKDKNNIAIEISDTGIGISEEHIPRIFDRFYVVDKSRSKESGGTGLGLSIVKHIVALHRGEIAVESKLNHGTKFIIILPQNIN